MILERLKGRSLLTLLHYWCDTDESYKFINFVIGTCPQTSVGPHPRKEIGHRAAGTLEYPGKRVAYTSHHKTRIITARAARPDTR